MLNRVRNRLSQDWPRYGGRGIGVCERWLYFANFLADIGPRPHGTSLDRVNNDGNYEPGNCRWATKKQQNQNRRNSLAPERKTAIAALRGHFVAESVAEALGMSASAVRSLWWRAARANQNSERPSQLVVESGRLKLAQWAGWSA